MTKNEATDGMENSHLSKKVDNNSNKKDYLL